MASPSLTLSAPPPANPTGSDPLSEQEKIVLQDLMAERAKLRDGIPDTLRYAGIVLVAAIAWLVNLPPPTQQATQPDQSLWFVSKVGTLGWLSIMLLGGFAYKVMEMIQRLQRLNTRILHCLEPQGPPIKDEDQPIKDKDKDMVHYGFTILKATGILLALLVVTVVLFSFAGYQLRHNTSQKQTPAITKSSLSH